MKVLAGVVALALALAVGWFVLAGPSEPEEGMRTDLSAVASPVEVQRQVDAGARLVDVRTPREYAAGHVDGARNLDVEGDDFTRRVRGLDPDTAYVVYCSTGRRAGEAIERMRDLGFTRLTNGGGYDDLASLDIR